jgi:hypothetical protein
MAIQFGAYLNGELEVGGVGTSPQVELEYS